jgi:hypothetical protein
MRLVQKMKEPLSTCVTKLTSEDMLNVNLTYGCTVSLKRTLDQMKKNDLMA